MQSSPEPRRRSYVRPLPVSPLMKKKKKKNEPPKHFLKVILPSPIHANELRIPEEFITRFGNELSTNATITVPDSCVWEVELKKWGNDVWFCKGWREFAKYYSINYGSFLLFKYEGNSDFHVLIFDITAAEICYPCKKIQGTNEEPNLDRKMHRAIVQNHSGRICKPNSRCSRKRSRLDYRGDGYATRSKKHRQENEVEIIDFDDVNLRSQRKLRKKEEYTSHGEQKKSGCNQKHASRMSNSSSKLESSVFKRKGRASDDAKNSRAKNPCFITTIRNCPVYVPAAFATQYLKLKAPVKLQNSNGQQWEVSCAAQGKKSAAMRITGGWADFARDNHFSVGDDCVFELIKKRKYVVLKVSMIYAVE